MIPLQLGFAFSAGIAAAFNPCGIAVLPSYISLFLTEDGEETDCIIGKRKTLGSTAAGLTMTAGFFSIFVILGTVFSFVGQRVISAVAPWFTLTVGAGLVVLGMANIGGRGQLSVSFSSLTSKLENLGREGCLKPFYFYGLGYALASIGCTLPIFLMVISQTLISHSYFFSLLVFLAYVAGMGIVVTGVAIASQLLRETLTKWLDKFLPYVKQLTGVIIFFAGIYLIFTSIN